MFKGSKQSIGALWRGQHALEWAGAKEGGREGFGSFPLFISFVDQNQLRSLVLI